MDNPGTGITRGPGSIALHMPARIDDPDDTEFERRFLVSDEGVLSRASGVTRIIQGYLWASNGYAVRVRLSQPEAPHSRPTATLTLKGPRIESHRYEIETPVDRDHAQRIIDAADHVIAKRRHRLVEPGGEVWVIDVFDGRNDGLVLAEFEASRVEVNSVAPPPWTGPEVTRDARYDNENLARIPYSAWSAGPTPL